ncbi:MAG: cytochrome c biogenesis protein CcdA, partial [Dehalococcoidia bacterium]
MAFSAGLLSFISPCVLPLVPAYIANLAGTTAIEAETRTSRWPT